jgi:hypothetical protein
VLVSEVRLLVVGDDCQSAWSENATRRGRSGFPPVLDCKCSQSRRAVPDKSLLSLPPPSLPPVSLLPPMMFRNSILLLDTVVVVTAQVRLALLLAGCGTGCGGGDGNSGGTGSLGGRVSSLSSPILFSLLLLPSFLFAVRYGCRGHRHQGEWYAGSVVPGWTLLFFPTTRRDDVTTAGSYSVLYYYAGCCVNPLPAITVLTDVVGTVDAGDRTDGDRLCYVLAACETTTHFAQIKRALKHDEHLFPPKTLINNSNVRKHCWMIHQ